jgi:hypothetical protein
MREYKNGQASRAQPGTEQVSATRARKRSPPKARLAVVE